MDMLLTKAGTAPVIISPVKSPVIHNWRHCPIIRTVSVAPVPSIVQAIVLIPYVFIIPLVTVPVISPVTIASNVTI